MIAPSAKAEIYLPPAAGDTLIQDDISTKQLEEIAVQIPASTPAGHNTIVVQVYDSKGILREKALNFCKTLDGFINWDDICSDLPAIAGEAELNKITDVAKLPAYNVAVEPRTNLKIVIAGLATTIAVLGGGLTGGFIEDIKREELLRLGRRERWGDRSRLWRFFGRIRFEKFIERWSIRISRRNFLIARVMIDAGYLRAMFGTLSTLLYPIAIGTTIAAASSVHYQAMPPRWTFLAALVLIGILDAGAGFISAALLWVLVLATGHMNSWSAFLTLLGISLTLFGPLLIVGSVRAIRRTISNSDDRWERITDFAVAPILGGWLVSKFIGAFDGLAHLQFGVTHKAWLIGILAGVTIFLRYCLEEFALRFFPVRVDAVTPYLEKPNTLYKLIGSLANIALFTILAYRFIGISLALFAAVVIDGLPKIIKAVNNRAPIKSRVVHRSLPKGILLIVVLVILQLIIIDYLQRHIESTSTMMQISFVAIGIPGFVVAILTLLSQAPEDIHWRLTKSGRIVWRVLGIAIYALFVLLAFGVDIGEAIQNWIIG